ncbi:MAG: hypothetical protein HOV81_39990 [Kofleriaceae bacterium]|nr:hypothetical protein [Kofleriaceae bacterium]
MRVDVVRWSWLALVLAVGCRDKTPPPTATQAPAPVVPSAAAAPADAVLPLGDAALADAAIPTDDAGRPADDAAVGALSPAALAAAVWPTAIESTMVETQRTIGEFELDVAYPRFRTRPPEIANALNARLAPLIEHGLDPNKYQGRFDLHCVPRVVNRLVVIFDFFVDAELGGSLAIASLSASRGSACAGP